MAKQKQEQQPDNRFHIGSISLGSAGRCNGSMALHPGALKRAAGRVVYGACVPFTTNRELHGKGYR